MKCGACNVEVILYMYTNFCNDIKMIVWWNVNPLPTVHASPTLYLSPYSK